MYNNVMYIKKIIIYKNKESEENKENKESNKESKESNKESKENKGNNERTNGFVILKDKNEIEKKLYKTKLCSYGNQCKRGSKCRFAHSKEELVINNCVFGNSCKFIKKEDDRFRNISKTKICTHKHPGENMNNFRERININNTFVIRI